jgi:hypothetical protein
MQRLFRCVVVVALLLGVCSAGNAYDAGSQEQYIRLHYTKQEHYLPMRDGVKLFTSIYVPRDATRTYPILIKRTPYSVAPYGQDKFAASLGPSEHFVRAGYIFVNQDVRGRFLSEGEFVQVTPHHVNKAKPSDIDESSDTYDTIEWLLANVHGHNGRIGMYGISYPGFYASAGMVDAHPALKAVSPQAPVADWYFDDFLHNGAFFLAHAYRWLGNNATARPRPTTDRSASVAYPTPDGYKLFLEAGSVEQAGRVFQEVPPFWNEMMLHPNRDAFWQKRAILPHLKNVAPAVMLVTGWFDAEDLYGSFKSYQAIETQNPNVNNVLVVGPWSHGGWASGDGDHLGPIAFGSNTAVFYRQEIEWPFFERHLKDQPGRALSEATVFETGGNTWREFDAWPPRHVESRQLFLQEAGRLDFAAPTRSAAFDEYISDPAKPVPFTAKITPVMAIEYMVDDQRFASRRPDVLAYQTNALDEDLVIAGPIEVELWASTTGTDSDFVVKLVDVFPNSPDPDDQPGFEMMIRSEVFRGRFRNSFEKPEPFVPGQPTRITFELLDVLHRFRIGHRVMIQIQSTWFPLVDRNPQKFVPNIYFAKPDDFQKATQRIYRSAEYPTSVRLGVLPAR